MTGLDLLLAVAGVAVTVMVIAGMILLTPRGSVDVHRDVDHDSGADGAPKVDDRRPRPESAPQLARREPST